MKREENDTGAYNTQQSFVGNSKPKDVEIANVAFYSSFNKLAHCSAMSQNYTIITHYGQNHLACLICFKNKVSM